MHVYAPNDRHPAEHTDIFVRAFLCRHCRVGGRNRRVLHGLGTYLPSLVIGEK